MGVFPDYEAVLRRARASRRSRRPARRMSTVKIPPVLRARPPGGEKEVEASRRERRRGAARAGRAAPRDRVAAVRRGRRRSTATSTSTSTTRTCACSTGSTRRVGRRHDRDPAGDGRRRTLVVRPASADDIEPCGRLWEDCARAAFATLLPEGHPFPEPAPERMREGLADPAVSLLVAGEGDALAGFVGCGSSRDPDAPAEVGEVRSLFVGVGRLARRSRPGADATPPWPTWAAAATPSRRSGRSRTTSAPTASTRRVGSSATAASAASRSGRTSWRCVTGAALP